MHLNRVKWLGTTAAAFAHTIHFLTNCVSQLNDCKGKFYPNCFSFLISLSLSNIKVDRILERLSSVLKKNKELSWQIANVNSSNQLISHQRITLFCFPNCSAINFLLSKDKESLRWQPPINWDQQGTEPANNSRKCTSFVLICASNQMSTWQK